MIYNIIKSTNPEFQEICNYCETNVVLENLRENDGTLNFSALTYHCDYLIIAIDKEIIGFNALILDPKVGFYVNQIALKKEYKQKGIGTNLMKIAISLATKNSLPICAHVRSYNIASQKMFEKCGFKKEGRYSDENNYFFLYYEKEYGGKLVNGG